MNLDQYAKNQDFLSFCSRDIVNFKILQSDWSRAFWRISQNQIFPKYGIYARIQQIIQTFFIDQIQKKTITKFFNKFKNPIFGIFLGQKIFFSKNPAPWHTTTYGPLTPWWVSEKTNEPISRKIPDRRSEGWMERP